MIGLGIFVFLKNPKKKLNLVFLLFCLSVSTWLLSSFMMYKSRTDTGAIFWDRIVYLGVVFIPVLMYHFGLIFTDSEKKNKKKLYLGYFLSFVFVILSRTDYFVADLYKYSWGVHTQARFFHHLFLVFFFFYVFLFIFEIYNYLKFTKEKKKEIEISQVKYLFISFIAMNMAAYAFLAAYRININPIGAYWVETFSVIILALAITRYHLFEIRVILTELLVVAIGIILLILPFLMPTPFLMNLTMIIFILFCIFGYLLIKATHDEIKKREEIEKLSEELKVSNVRLNAALKELEKSYAKLKKIDEAKTQFFSIASHQLRTPLSVIKGYLSMALSGKYGNIDKEPKKFLKNVYESTERLIRLVNDFLNISRFQMGVIKFVFNETPIEELVRSVVKELSSTAKLKGLYLELAIVGKGHSKSKKVFLKADSQKIRQVILNLVDNAIKYTEKGGVSVKCQAFDGRYRIEIEDTGIGMDREEKEKLFKVFERGEKATSISPGGVGIGLFIAKEIVKAHKGKIWAESKGLGKGSRFVVELSITHE